MRRSPAAPFPRSLRHYMMHGLEDEVTARGRGQMHLTVPELLNTVKSDRGCSAGMEGRRETQAAETLTPELKYRVHSPPPVPEKKTTVSFPSPDPEQLRQNILSAIRSGEAAAKLKRITIRSNTISINGKSQISHPTFSQTLPED